jgi:hypothetical protein
MNRNLAALAAVACIAFPSAASAQDWKAVADTDTIQVVTKDELGAPRETTIWLAVYEGHGYIRTGGTRWGDNVRRDPDVLVRIGGDEYSLRAVPVPPGDATYTAMTDVFRSKYGFSDAALSLVRGIGGAPTIMRLDPR